MDPHLTPEAKNIGLDSASRRTVIEEPSHTTVDLKRRDVEQTPLQSIDDGLPERLAVKRAVSGAGDGRLELLLDGGFLELESVEEVDGGVDLGLSCAGGLESAYGVTLGLDGGGFLREELTERLFGGVH